MKKFAVKTIESKIIREFDPKRYDKKKLAKNLANQGVSSIPVIGLIYGWVVAVRGARKDDELKINEKIKKRK